MNIHHHSSFSDFYTVIWISWPAIRQLRRLAGCIMMRECFQCSRLPLVPAPSNTHPPWRQPPIQMVAISGLTYCMVSHPGQLNTSARNCWCTYWHPLTCRTSGTVTDTVTILAISSCDRVAEEDDAIHHRSGCTHPSRRIRWTFFDDVPASWRLPGERRSCSGVLLEMPRCLTAFLNSGWSSCW